MSNGRQQESSLAWRLLSTTRHAMNTLLSDPGPPRIVQRSPADRFLDRRTIVFLRKCGACWAPSGCFFARPTIHLPQRRPKEVGPARNSKRQGFHVVVESAQMTPAGRRTRSKPRFKTLLATKADGIFVSGVRTKSCHRSCTKPAEAGLEWALLDEGDVHRRDSPTASWAGRHSP